MAAPVLGASHSRRTRLQPPYGLSARQFTEARLVRRAADLAVVDLPSLRRARGYLPPMSVWRNAEVISSGQNVEAGYEGQAGCSDDVVKPEAQNPAGKGGVLCCQAVLNCAGFARPTKAGFMLVMLKELRLWLRLQLYGGIHLGSADSQLPADQCRRSSCQSGCYRLER